MTVPDTDHPAIVVAVLLAVDFHQTKIPLAFMRQRMCLVADGEPGRFEGFLDGVDEIGMRDRTPAFG